MLIVDTSVAVKWVAPETDAHREADTEAALRILERGLVAPECILGEFANALFKKIQRGEIGREQADQSIAILPNIVRFEPIQSLIVPAFDLACTLSHPVHDCLFLALAIQLDVELVTADRVFVDQCRKVNQNYPIRLLVEAL
jgi:predicted nucleic acid-binding protein